MIGVGIYILMGFMIACWLHFGFVLGHIIVMASSIACAAIGVWRRRRAQRQDFPVARARPR